MAKQYPFQLDPFQSTAIACLVCIAQCQVEGLFCDKLTAQMVVQERKESVLVAAHTSAGKTAVAE